MEGDTVKAALNAVTTKFIDELNESNFYLEMGQSMGNFGDIGNACLYTELYEGHLNFRSHYIDNFYIRENYREEIDTVFRSFTLTARQAVQQFGEDEVPVRILDASTVANKAGEEFNFIHVTLPRVECEHGSSNKLKKPVASYYLCEEDKEWSQESGFDEMPYAVGRFYKTNYEVYGRSPAIEVGRTLPMINSMEITRIRSAERVSNPPWLAPNDGSTRRISNDQGSIIYWNPNNPMSKPEQLVAQDNPLVNDEMINSKNQEILDAFYVPLFNPLEGLKNMSATESSQRVDLSLQFLTPAVIRIEREFVKPTLERAFGVLQRAGKFPELDIPELSEASIDFELVGKANLASRQIELYGVMTAIEQMGMIGQVKPDIWDNFDHDAFAAFSMEVNMAPLSLKVHEDIRDEKRQVRADQLKREQDAQMAGLGAEAYAKSSKTAEEGSPAAEMQEQAQQQ
jgi:hypothetical protein